VVTDISLSPNNEIVYVIRNIGAGDVTQPILIQIYVDNASVDSNRKISSLGAGQEVSLFFPNYYMSGTHSVTVRVNADQAIQESNFRDNELTRALSGPTPTPIPSPSPSATPAK
jgi:subtilase family serine protease